MNFEDLKQLYGITTENRNIQHVGALSLDRDGNG